MIIAMRSVRRMSWSEREISGEVCLNCLKNISCIKSNNGVSFFRLIYILACFMLESVTLEIRYTLRRVLNSMIFEGLQEMNSVQALDPRIEAAPRLKGITTWNALLITFCARIFLMHHQGIRRVSWEKGRHKSEHRNPFHHLIMGATIELAIIDPLNRAFAEECSQRCIITSPTKCPNDCRAEERQTGR